MGGTQSTTFVCFGILAAAVACGTGYGQELQVNPGHIEDDLETPAHTQAQDQLVIKYSISKREVSDCTGDDVFWDVGEGRCKVCTRCGTGQQSTARFCGFGMGMRGACVGCPEDHFRDALDTNQTCHACSSCDPDASILVNCSKSSDTICGPCKAGMGYYDSGGYCVSCSDYPDADGCPADAVTEGNRPAPSSADPSASDSPNEHPSPPPCPSYASKHGVTYVSIPTRHCKGFNTVRQSSQSIRHV